MENEALDIDLTSDYFIEDGLDKIDALFYDYLLDDLFELFLSS